MIKGNRPYLINRMPFSVHRNLLTKEGYELATEIIYKSESKINMTDIANLFKSVLLESDLTISGAFVQAIKTN